MSRWSAPAPRFSRAEFYAYAMPLVFIPILVQLAAVVLLAGLSFAAAIHLAGALRC